MAFLTLHRITRNFGETSAIRDFSLEIEQGEFFALVGPSGCGKSTLLRVIAGLDSPSAGEISVAGRNLTGVPPRERGIGLVFQNYALFPHMTVAENVAYGLEGRKIPRAEIAARVDRMLQSVGLHDRSSAPVTTLSGGEQQRVAVARAMVVEPSILLFDEPLSNLDLALRHRTREEIRNLQRRTGITTIYVTHDQEEALTLADRIGVMRAGELEQVGRPEELYERPATPFVAEFLGGSNLIDATQGIPIPSAILSRLQQGSMIAVKPEGISISDVAGEVRGEGSGFEATIVEREYLGFTTTFTLRTGGTELRVRALTSGLRGKCQPEDRVICSIDWSRAVVVRGR